MPEGFIRINPRSIGDTVVAKRLVVRGRKIANTIETEAAPAIPSESTTQETEMRHTEASDKPIETLLADVPTTCELLGGISPRTLFSLTKSGRVPSLRIGGRVLYSREALRRWIEAEQTGANHHDN
jgi:excisionase family DNA binding protein